MSPKKPINARAKKAAKRISSSPAVKTGSYKKKLKAWLKKRPLTNTLIFLAIIGILLGCLIGVGVLAYFSQDLPDPDRIMERKVIQSTKIYDRTGEILLYDIHGEEQRTLMSLEDIPEQVKQATIALEDKNFYEHKGISLAGIVRSAWKNVTTGSRVGGSTITQQFIKNAILTTEKSYSRKIKEVILSYQIERKFTKDQILQLYLNEIPYGSTAYGIEAASQLYLKKSVKDVTLAEACALASLPRAPSAYSPWTQPERLKVRQEYCLDLMAEQSYITEDEAEEAKAIELNFVDRQENILAPHFVMYVRELLEEKYSAKLVEEGGLKVITTLDMDKQKVAEEAVVNGVARNESRYNATNAALVSVDTKTGEILAMVGSRDYFDLEHDGNVNVTTRLRQPGSSFKPVVYATAFAKGYTPQTMLFDLVTTFPTETAPYIPHNYDLGARGPVSMKMALAGSLNIPAVKTLYLAGLETVLDQAEKLGYTTFGERDRFGLSLVLGGGEVTLLEHVSAFATFAREGLRYPTTPILRIEDSDGGLVEEHKVEEERALDEQAARQINDILSDNGARAYVFGGSNDLIISGRPIAAKTGTTNDYRDAWTLGYTPSIAAGVWAGNNDNSEMARGAAGAVVAAPIWNEYMTRVLEGQPVEDFQKPEPAGANKAVLSGQIDILVPRKVDKVTGQAIPEDCSSYPSEFIEERELKETHTILHFVNKDDPLGPAPATQDDPMYGSWEAAVEQWAFGQGYLTEEYEYADCHLRDPDKMPNITILNPSSVEDVTSETFTIQVKASGSRAVKQVEYYIDNVLIGTVTDSPYSLKYTTSLQNGIHKLQAKVIDAVDNHQTADVDFNLQIKKVSTSISLTSPSSGQSLSASSFPVSLSALATDSEGVTQVRFFYYNLDSPSAAPNAVTTITDITGETVSTTWATAPAAGDYGLYADMRTGMGSIVRSDTVNISITN